MPCQILPSYLGDLAFYRWSVMPVMSDACNEPAIPGFYGFPHFPYSSYGGSTVGWSRERLTVIDGSLRVSCLTGTTLPHTNIFLTNCLNQINCSHIRLQGLSIMGTIGRSLWYISLLLIPLYLIIPHSFSILTFIHTFKSTSWDYSTTLQTRLMHTTRSVFSTSISIHLG